MMLKKIWIGIRRSPLPFFSLFGLCAGLLFYFGFDNHPFGETIWYTTLVIGGAPIVYKTLLGIFRGRFASDIIAMLAIFAALLFNQAFAGTIIVLMQSGGEAIEAYGLRRATSTLTALLKRAPRVARRKKNNQMEEVPVHSVMIGDVLIVRPGDLVPVDGTILSGTTEIDESAVTGEPLTHIRNDGDQLLSGSINVNGVIEMRADRTSRESQYSKIVQLVKEAHEKKAPLQRLADRYAIFFTPLTLVMGGLGYLITGDPSTILSVLVVATPCPLILAAPLAVICGINRAAERGIIVKGGAPLEEIASARVALFDKTGTITFGSPFVETVVSLGDEDEKSLLLHAAIIDQLSAHSTAKAIVQKALSQHSSLPLPIHFHEIPGQGVEGEIGPDRYAIGSQAFIESKAGKESVNRHRNLINLYFEKNDLLVFVAKNQNCIGMIVLSDKIRPEVPTMMQSLRSLGIEEITMLTGDGERNAAVIAKQAGIHHFQANLMPEQKVRTVQEFSKKYHHSIMVGDGINDAPALATATVGIAMGAHGTAISAEAADIVLLVDDLTRVSDALAIGKRMLFIAKQSIWIGMSLSFFLMILAANGRITPALGAMLQEIIDIAVILNALRAR